MTAAAAPTAPTDRADGSGPEGTQPQEPGSAQASPGQRLKVVAEQLLVKLIDKVAGVALEQADGLIGKLDDIAAQGGPGLQAAIAAGKAVLSGNNPVWAAIRTGFGSLSTGMKVLLVVAVGLVLILAPVLLVIVLLAALVAAIVAAIRAAVR